MHVTGKIRWDTYEQAKHVSTLYNVHGKTYDWLATHLRLSKSKITQQLKAYSWTNRGDLDGLRARAGAGDGYAALRLADLLASCGDLDQALQILRAQTDAGNGGPGG